MLVLKRKDGSQLNVLFRNLNQYALIAWFSWNDKRYTDRNIELSTDGSFQNQHYSREIDRWCYGKPDYPKSLDVLNFMFVIFLQLWLWGLGVIFDHLNFRTFLNAVLVVWLAPCVVVLNVLEFVIRDMTASKSIIIYIKFVSIQCAIFLTLWGRSQTYLYHPKHLRGSIHSYPKQFLKTETHYHHKHHTHHGIKT